MRLSGQLLVLFLVLFQESVAQDGTYAVSKIPETLLTGSDIVVRDEKVVIQVNSESDIIIHKKYAYTILNADGAPAANFAEYYDDLRDIRNVEGRLFDSEGMELKKLKTKDMQDLSGVSGGNFMTDYRIKSHNFHAVQYPYTVEYSFETRCKSLFFLPAWIPRDRENLSVQQSSITLVTPAEFEIRHKPINLSEPPIELIDKNKKTLTWSLQNLEAAEDDFATPDWYDFNPAVIFAPASFSLQGYKGQMNTWNEFALFTNSLRKSKELLPEAIKQKVKTLAGPLTDKKEKIKVLYEFLQANTRYVSIQLGVGGWVPFDAEYVAKNSYGDCKALSNYMVALLNEAGIPACYTLIRAGDNASEIVADFPSQQFNHAIVCVPMEKDSIWLECTSQVTPMGYLGTFTGDRLALVVSESGGKLVKTPVYRMEQNRQIRTIRAEIDPSGDLSGSIQTTYQGLQQDDLNSLITHKTREELKQYLQRALPLPTYQVNQFDYVIRKDLIPSITETIGVSVSLYATITGKRMFITPNLVSKDGRKLSSEKTRVLPIKIVMPYWDTDTVEIVIPPGYKLETGAGKKEHSSVFGSYETKTEIKNGRLMYYRNYRRFSGKFSEEHYEELAKFLSDIYASDRSRIVLIKE